MRTRTILGTLSLVAAFLATVTFANAQVGTSSKADGKAHAASTTTIKGRVLNGSNGSYLNNAKIQVNGTGIETFTTESGDYQLINLPAGALRITASFSGLNSQTIEVTADSGTLLDKDFELTVQSDAAGKKEDIITLEKYTVRADELTKQAVALQERKNAANIKNVIAVDEDLGERNIGEYIKTTPGVALDLNPQSPSFISLRGMPISGTVITTDGAEVATSGISGRAVDLGLVTSGNIERIEVTKVPTPDMQANAVGGAVNIISKSAFSRKKPLFSYNVAATNTTRDGFSGNGLGSFFSRSEGVDAKSNVRFTQPSVTLSYLWPVTKSLGVNLSFSQSNRYSDWDFRQVAWNKVTQLKTTDVVNPLPLGENKTLAALKLDWKIKEGHVLSAGASYTTQENFVRQNRILFNYGAGATGGENFMQGAATGVGNSQMAPVGNNQHKFLSVFNLAHRYTGRLWKIDGNVGYSEAQFDLDDISNGFFGTVTSAIPNLVLRNDYGRPDDRRIGTIAALDRLGAPVNVYDFKNYNISSVASSERLVQNTVESAAINASRTLETSFPVSFKVGASIKRMGLDDDNATLTWAFTPPGGVAAQNAGNYDLAAGDYEKRVLFTDFNNRPVSIRYLSAAKVKALYDTNPSWFVLNESAAHISRANLTKTIDETITAAYIRTDVKFLRNRLWLVGGVRFEQTDDEGYGVQNDIRRTYVQDANGNLVLNSSGQPIKVTTDALANTKLQYTIRGAHSKARYSGFYPSFNASYSFTNNIILRAAYARTIGRPDLDKVIPGLTISDPSSPTTPTITAINSALRPWTADNYDLTFEVYEIKGVTASVSLFRKDLVQFFVTTRLPADADSLAGLGLSDDYLNYDIITTTNGGAASLEGIEFDYRQSLLFLPPWARGVQVYANFTTIKLGGPNANDFTNFTAQTGNWGLTFTRPKFSARVGVNYTGARRTALVAASATVPAGSYNQFAPMTRIDASISYMFNRKFSIYGDVRNLTGAPLRRGVWAPTTPDYARIDLTQYGGALFTLGVKGSF